MKNGKGAHKQQSESTSSPGSNDDTSLPPLLLPGGRVLNANVNSMGKRLGIEILEQTQSGSGSETEKKKANSRTSAEPETDGNLLYPSPENAGVYKKTNRLLNTLYNAHAVKL